MNKCSPRIEINGFPIQQPQHQNKHTNILTHTSNQKWNSPSLKTLVFHKHLTDKKPFNSPLTKQRSTDNLLKKSEMSNVNIKKCDSDKNNERFNKEVLKQEKQTRSNNHLLQASIPYQFLEIPKTLDIKKSLTKSKEKNRFFRKSGEKQHTFFETNSPKNTFLKETSSTTSTDIKCPTFFRTRNNKEKFQNRFSEKNFVKLKEIGRGKFGKVWIVRQKKTNFCLALKILDKSYFKKENNLNQLIRELKIQAFLDHSYIIKLYGFFHDDYNFYIMLQLACDGQLFNFIQAGMKFSQQSVSFIVGNLLQGIDYMHDMKILHRDVKPENIVVTHGIVKLCDFGCAVQMTENELRSTFCGTPLYFSPELLKYKRYDEKVDLWALGILAYELYYNHSPFQIYTQSDIDKIMTDKISYTDRPISDDFKKFLQKILEKIPEKRFNSKQLLKMPFIQCYKQLDTCQQLCR